MAAAASIQPERDVVVEHPPEEYLSASVSDASSRGIVLFILFQSLVWLVIASVLGVINSIKLHAPHLLSGSAWLTYGRLKPAQTNLFLYGFAFPAAIGVSLWILCRLGRSRLVGHGVLLLGSLTWNLGVLVGTWGIVSGDSTGFELLEYPKYASPILYFGALMIGLVAVLTFHARQKRDCYVSQWFIVTALFWFPWIYSGANLLLVAHPVRGVVQAAIVYWYGKSMVTICLGGLAMAILFYVVPKASKRPLYSSYGALLSFWLWILFGSWGGAPADSSLPAWIGSMSLVANSLMFLSAAATFWNLWMTWSDGAVEGSNALKLAKAAAFAFVIASAGIALSGFAKASVVLQLTHFQTALNELSVLGFAGLAVFSAIHLAVPLMVGTEWKCTLSATGHRMASILGIGLIAVGLGVGGIFQGLALRQGSQSFLEIVHKLAPFVGIATTGYLAFALGSLVLLLNFSGTVGSAFCPFREKQKVGGKAR